MFSSEFAHLTFKLSTSICDYPGKWIRCDHGNIFSDCVYCVSLRLFFFTFRTWNEGRRESLCPEWFAHHLHISRTVRFGTPTFQWRNPNNENGSSVGLHCMFCCQNLHDGCDVKGILIPKEIPSLCSLCVCVSVRLVQFGLWANFKLTFPNCQRTSSHGGRQ